MIRLLLLLCRVLLLVTLLLWVWLLWSHGDPEVLLFPAGVVYLGLSLHRIPRLPTLGERWHALQMTIRTGCCFLMIVLTFHLLPFAQALGLALDDAPPTPPAVPEQLLQGVLQSGYWIVAVVVVLLALLHLPGVERHLNAWEVHEGAEP